MNECGGFVCSTENAANLGKTKQSTVSEVSCRVTDRAHGASTMKSIKKFCARTRKHKVRLASPFASSGRPLSRSSLFRGTRRIVLSQTPSPDSCRSLTHHSKYLTLSVMSFCSITSPSRSITTIRRLWSCAQRTSRTATSGWLRSHRPGTLSHATSPSSEVHWRRF